MAETDEDFLKPSDVAKIFKVDPKTVTRWGQQGKLPCVRTPGGHHRYRRSDIEKFLKESNGSV